MRVLLVCHGYPPFGIAGVERLSAQTAESLARRGHDVTVLTRRPSVAPPTLRLERDVRAGVSVISVAGAGPTYDRFPGHDEELDLTFERVLAELDPDVVLLSHLLHHSPAYVGIAHRWRIPVVVELHDFYFACPRAHLERLSGERCDGPEGGAACARYCFPHQQDAPLTWPLRAHTFRRALHTADAVVCPSRFVADYFKPMRDDAPPIQVVGNGVPASFPRRQLTIERDESAPLRIASIGVAVHHKGFHVVIDALRRAALPAVEYTILGMPTSPYDDELREAANAVRGLALRMLGKFEPEQLPALLAGTDVAVVPSLVAETYSIAAREALACGVPVVAARIGALPDAIRHGENGFLYGPDDITELSLLLRRLSEDRHLVRMLAAGIRADDVLTVDQRTERIEQILAEIVSAGARAISDEDVELRLLRDAVSTTSR